MEFSLIPFFFFILAQLRNNNSALPAVVRQVVLPHQTFKEGGRERQGRIQAFLCARTKIKILERFHEKSRLNYAAFT